MLEGRFLFQIPYDGAWLFVLFVVAQITVAAIITAWFYWFAEAGRPERGQATSSALEMWPVRALQRSLDTGRNNRSRRRYTGASFHQE